MCVPIQTEKLKSFKMESVKAEEANARANILVTFFVTFRVSATILVNLVRASDGVRCLNVGIGNGRTMLETAGDKRTLLATPFGRATPVRFVGRGGCGVGSTSQWSTGLRH